MWEWHDDEFDDDVEDTDDDARTDPEAISRRFSSFQNYDGFLIKNLQVDISNLFTVNNFFSL